MKKICGIVLLLTLFTTVNAQIKRKSVLLGGQISFEQQKSNNQDTNNLFQQTNRSGTYGLSLGIAVKRNLVVGLTGSISPGKISILNNGTLTTTETDRYEAGIFLRRYQQLLRRFYFFGEIDATGNIAKTESSTLNSGISKEKGVRLGVTPGLSYQVARKLHLEIAIHEIVGVGYSKFTHDLPDPQPDSHSEKISFSTSLNSDNKTLGGVGIGVRLIL